MDEGFAALVFLRESAVELGTRPEIHHAIIEWLRRA
jgi:hypothetical protein